VLWDTENLSFSLSFSLWKLLSVKIILQTSHTQVLMAFSRTELPPESVRIQIKLRGEVCELELSGASRRVLMSNRGGADAIKSDLIDSGEITVVRISAFCHDFLEQWAAPNLILSDCSIYTVKNILYLC